MPKKPRLFRAFLVGVGIVAACWLAVVGIGAAILYGMSALMSVVEE